MRCNAVEEKLMYLVEGFSYNLWIFFNSSKMQMFSTYNFLFQKSNLDLSPRLAATLSHTSSRILLDGCIVHSGDHAQDRMDGDDWVLHSPNSLPALAMGGGSSQQATA